MAAPRPDPASSSSATSRGAVPLPADHAQPHFPSPPQEDKLFAARIAHLTATRTDLQLDLLRKKLERLKEEASAQKHGNITSKNNPNGAALDLARFVNLTNDTLNHHRLASARKRPRTFPKNGFSRSRNPRNTESCKLSAVPGHLPAISHLPNHSIGHSSSPKPTIAPIHVPFAATPGRHSHPHPDSHSPPHPHPHSYSHALTVPCLLPYVTRPPPLLATLYFKEELAALLPSHSQPRTGSTPTAIASLCAATRAYHAHLFSLHFPPPGDNSVILARTEPTNVNVHAVQSQLDASAVAARRQQRGLEAFQTRTYFAGMTRADERRAPAAPWPINSRLLPTSCEDLVPRSGYGYASYRIDSYRPALGPAPPTGVLRHFPSPSGNASNFGFQKQTNYLFRLTYNTSAPASLAEPPVPSTTPVCRSHELQLAGRIPVQDLSTPLRQLLSTAITQPRGSFFQQGHLGSSMTFESAWPERSQEDLLYIIGEDGRLVQRTLDS